jgi:hypothetical protein
VSSEKGERCTNTGKKAGESINGGIATCSNRDAATFKALEDTRKEWEEPVRRKFREQLVGLNTKYSANFTNLVPIWDALLSLRQGERS